MENKKIYTAPEMEITVFEYTDGTDDAVVTSPTLSVTGRT